MTRLFVEQPRLHRVCKKIWKYSNKIPCRAKKVGTNLFKMSQTPRPEEHISAHENQFRTPQLLYVTRIHHFEGAPFKSTFRSNEKFQIVWV